ncbi:MAG TPA: class I SAM-dependent methyltransferase [Nocardioides sp.]|nr:class I SAM-dependent methyltransferase [Nocardioides sp.]
MTHDADDYRTLNRLSWDERAPAHAASPGYNLDAFRQDPKYLSDVVRFDLPLLGDVSGLRGVHLQCHIGTDTISLARLGARMTGLDFSPAAVAQATQLSEELGAGVDFVEADVYDAAEVLPAGEFDLVFTGIGALCWLPSVSRWAEVVATLLKPGGRLFIREGHPMMWALADPLPEGRLELDLPYFELEEPNVWDEGGTYVATDVEFQHNVTKEWNHGLGEIVTALLDQGLVLETLVEHDSVPWDAFPGYSEELPDGEHRLSDRPWRLPHSYTISARKPRP